MNFEKFCKDVMAIDSNMRFVMVLNKAGEHVAGGYNENVTSMLNSNELEMVLYHAGQRWETRKNLAYKIGYAKYSLTEYEKVKRITFPVNEKHLLLVSTETQADHAKIIDTILNLIEDQSKE